MSFTGNCSTTSFKVQLLKAQHDFSAAGGHTFKMALYGSSATLGPNTTDYTTTGEIVATGYTAGGQALTNVEPSSGGTTAFANFATITWTADFSLASDTLVYGALIYNTTTGGGVGTTDSVAVIDFGGGRASVGGVFTVTMPTADASNSLIRIA